MRTASGDGTRFALRKRRTFAYDAPSTSIENVVVDSLRASLNPFSSIAAYRATGAGSSGAIATFATKATASGGAGVATNTPPAIPPATPVIAGAAAVTVIDSLVATCSVVSARTICPAAT